MATDNYIDKLKARQEAEAAAKFRDVQTKSTESVAEAIHRLNLTTFLSTKDVWTDTVNDMLSLAEKTREAVKDMEAKGIKQDKSFTTAVTKLEAVAKKIQAIQSIKIESDTDAVRAVAQLSKTIASLDVKPVVNLPAPQVTLNERQVDLTPLLNTLEAIDSGVRALDKEQTNLDTSDLSKTLKDIEKAIERLIKKPAPGFAAPWQFRDTTGMDGPLSLVQSDSTPSVQAVPVVNPDGSDISAGGGGGGDTAPFGKYTESFSSLSDGETAQLRLSDDGRLLASVSGQVSVSGSVEFEGSFGTLEQLDLSSPAAATTPLTVAVVDGDGDSITDAANNALRAVVVSSALPTGAATQTTLNNVYTDTSTMVSHLNNIMPKASAATLTNVATSTASAQLLASNSARKKAVVVNEASSNLLVKLGTTASATSYTYLLQPSDTLEELNYTGRIDAILVSGTGTARVTEL
jgi:hypothetical protein